MPSLDEIPPLFRCKSSEEIRDVIKAKKGAIVDVFRGYNALHWYCDAKSTSPGIIKELLYRGIDINALDQRSQLRHRPVIRHTALGLACRNANVKAVHTLLQNGADPCGLTKSAMSLGLPKKNAHGKPIVYPSPLQELLCQPVHGPRPGRCPWTYHLNEEDEEKDSYLDEDNPERIPTFRVPHPTLSDIPPKYRPVCWRCAANYHIWEPWPETEEEKVAAQERRRVCYYGQILRLGHRLHACLQLLVDYNCSDPPVAFPECDDRHLWLGIDYFLETFWRFYHPLMVCEGMANSPKGDAISTSSQHLSHAYSRPVFSLFGEICDILIESAGYKGKKMMGTTRGQGRLISLIAEHSKFPSFRKGEYFDVDAQLERELSASSSSH
ncbi:hypothetical protein NUW58_g1531 [Xylaria curta]|uniref:Uncharacterized protein n=1 Tax=Xylaria curta TaxID=42375 RepID=A0ACC1PMI5_9PEZI|nr:hypothetical protein NUW58_g1531 [Xylaria curta]